MESHPPSENGATPSSVSIFPKKKFPASKTNQKAKYVINEQGKLVKLKSSDLPKNSETKPTDSNDSKDNESRLKQQQQLNKFHGEKPSKYVSEESLKFSTTKVSSVSKTSNQSSKCIINEQGKLVKIKSSSVANPPVVNTGNQGRRPLKQRPTQVDSHENKMPQEFEKSTTIEDSNFTNEINEQLNTDDSAKVTGFENSLAPFLKNQTSVSAPSIDNSESNLESEQVKISKIIASPSTTIVFSEPTTSSNQIIEFTCSHCNVGFATDGDLLTHIQNVHEDGKVGTNKCKYCDKVYFVPSDLKTHIQTVHLNQTVKCNFCDELFFRSDINKHVRNVHMKQYEAIRGFKQNVKNLRTSEEVTKTTTKEEENCEILKIPRKNASTASKTNQKSNYIINEYGKLVRLKSPISSDTSILTGPTYSNETSKNSPKSLKFPQLDEKNSKQSSKTSSSVLRKTNQKSVINEHGKLVKLSSPISNITSTQKNIILSEEMSTNSNETNTTPSEIPGKPPKNVSKIISEIQPEKTGNGNEVVVLEIEDDLAEFQKFESNLNPDRIESESTLASPETPKLGEHDQYVGDNAELFRIESDVEVATRTLSKENQEQNEEKLSGEILQSSDVGMDNNDATKFDSSNITNDKLNPSWVLESPIFMLKEETTRKKYVKTWLNFINAHGITRDNEPVEEDFLDWFANRKSIGMTLGTLKCEYSHLNMCVQIQYGYNLKKWPNIWTFLQATGEDPNMKKKPSFYFKNGELDQYLEEIDMNDCYLLVRAFVAVLTYFNHRILDMKLHMKWKDIKKCSEGYLFKCKDQKSNFLVPKKQENFFRIVNQYVERVNQDLSPGPGPNDEIFFKGRKFPDGTSRFIKLYLGIREIRGVPKHVAERLKLENPENYTRRSFRAIPTNWKDPTIATRYSQNSIPFQSQNIETLDDAGNDEQPPPSKKAKILEFQNESFDIEIQNKPFEETIEDLMSEEQEVEKSTKEVENCEIGFTEKDISTNVSSPETNATETRFENGKGWEISKITDQPEILKIPKTSMPASKTNQKSNYIVNEHGKLVRLKSTEKSADEILQSLEDFSMDDKDTISDPRIIIGTCVKNNGDIEPIPYGKSIMELEPSWILESPMFKSVIEDPMFKSMEKATYKRYRKTWLNFINFLGIDNKNAPVEEDFTNWFALRKSNGMCLATLKSEYSHLKKCFQTLCGISLSRKWPLIWKVIVDWPTEEEHIKKTCFFKNEQLERYFQDIDMTNCYKLVRGTVAVLTYYYKHVYWIKSHMKWKDIKKCPEGYLFKFSHPAKLESSHIKHAEFLVPKEAKSKFAILDEYINRVKKDLFPGPGPNDEIFYTGRMFPDRTSKFIRGYLGIKELRRVPKHVAKQLKLETPENYTRHSFFNLNVGSGIVKQPSDQKSNYFVNEHGKLAKKAKILDFEKLWNEPAFDDGEIQNQPCNESKEDLMSKYDLQLPIEITRKNSSNDFPSENTEIQNKPFEIDENLMSELKKLPIELTRITSSKAKFEKESSAMEIENESFMSKSMGVKEKLFYFKKKLDFEKSGKELKALPEKSTNSETEVDKQLTGNYLHENNEESFERNSNSKPEVDKQQTKNDQNENDEELSERNSEPEVDKQLTGSYQYENNEGLTKSKHNSKQIDEEIEKSMPVSANDENEESQLDQVYIFEQMDTVNQFGVENSLKDPLEIDRGIDMEIEEVLPNTPTMQQPLDYKKCVFCGLWIVNSLASAKAKGLAKDQMKDHYINKHYKEKSFDFLRRNKNFNPPYSCHIKNCLYSTRHLKDKTELLRHYTRYHSILERFYEEEFNNPTIENKKVDFTCENKSGQSFNCNICHFAFANEKILERHVAAKHNTGKNVKTSENSSSIQELSTASQNIDILSVEPKNSNSNANSDELNRRIMAESQFNLIHKESAKKMINLNNQGRFAGLQPPGQSEKNLPTEIMISLPITYSKGDKTINEVHEGQNENKCRSCGKLFSSKSNLKNHLNKVHKAIFHKCNYCDNSYIEPFELEAHVKSCHTYECDYCEKSFSSKQILKEHENIHTTKCDYCDKRYFESSDLIAHMQSVHYNVCDYCGKSFSSKTILKQHIHTHTTKNYFTEEKYCEFCGKDFPSPQIRNDHIREIHHIQIDHKCDYCEERFFIPSQLKSHVKSVHLNQRHHVCNHCNKEFQSDQRDSKIKQKIFRHIQNVHHGGSKNVKCGLCDAFLKQTCDSEKPVKNVQEEVQPSSLKNPSEEKEMANEELKVQLTNQLANELEKFRGSVNERNTEEKSNNAIPIIKTNIANQNQMIDQTNIENVHEGNKLTHKSNNTDNHINKVHEGHKKECKCDYCGKLFPDDVQLTNHLEEFNFCGPSSERKFDISENDEIVEKTELEKAIQNVIDQTKAIDNQVYQCDLRNSTQVNFRENDFAKKVKLESDIAANKKYSETKQENHVEVVLNPYKNDFNPAKIQSGLIPKPSEKMIVDQVHKCDLCFKRFSQKAKLNFHLLKVHRIEKPIENGNHDKSDATSKIVEKSSENSDNSLQITQEKSSCSKCKQSYKYNQESVQHQCLEVEIEKQETEIQKQDMETQKQKAFPCNICMENFPFDSLLEVHQRTKHKDNLENCNMEKVIKLKAPKIIPHDAEEKDKLAKPDPKHIMDSTKETNERRNETEKTNIDSNDSSERPIDRGGYKCYTCGKILSNFRNLKRHIQDLHPVRQHKFSRFSKKPHPFPSRQPRVIQTDSGFDPFSTTTSASVSEKDVHEGPKQNDAKNYKCDICGKTFHKLKNLRWHQKFHKGPHKCGCGKSYTVMADLKDHQETVHQLKLRKIYSCENCEHVCKSSLELSNHVETVHGERKYPCNQCDKNFATRGGLRKHNNFFHLGKYRKSIEKNEKCKLCSKAFERSSQLEYHIKSVHENIRDLKCEFCEKSFSSPNVRSHHVQKIHNQQKDHKCQYCDKCFWMPSELKIHVKSIHLNQRDFICNYCNQGFVTNGKLLKHIRQVHQGKKVQANTQTHTKPALELNSLLNTPTKTLDVSKFECDICHREFTRKDSIERHKINVHFNNILPADFKPTIPVKECEICNKTFQSKEIKVHMERAHCSNMGKNIPLVREGQNPEMENTSILQNNTTLPIKELLMSLTPVEIENEEIEKNHEGNRLELEKSTQNTSPIKELLMSLTPVKIENQEIGNIHEGNQLKLEKSTQNTSPIKELLMSLTPVKIENQEVAKKQTTKHGNVDEGNKLKLKKSTQNTWTPSKKDLLMSHQSLVQMENVGNVMVIQRTTKLGNVNQEGKLKLEKSSQNISVQESPMSLTPILIENQDNGNNNKIHLSNVPAKKLKLEKSTQNASPVKELPMALTPVQMENQDIVMVDSKKTTNLENVHKGKKLKLEKQTQNTSPIKELLMSPVEIVNQDIEVVNQKIRTNLEKVHEGNKLTCKICGQVKSNPDELKIHIKSAHIATIGRRNHSCPKCDKKFFTSAALKSHENTSHISKESVANQDVIKIFQNW